MTLTIEFDLIYLNNWHDILHVEEAGTWPDIVELYHWHRLGYGTQWHFTFVWVLHQISIFKQHAVTSRGQIIIVLHCAMFKYHWRLPSDFGNDPHKGSDRENYSWHAGQYVRQALSALPDILTVNVWENQTKYAHIWTCMKSHDLRFPIPAIH